MGDDALDSDVLAGTNRTGSVVLYPGQTNNTVDAGYYPSVPTAAEIRLRAFAAAEGVVVEFQSIDEAGTRDMILYIWRDGRWGEIGRQPSYGSGNHFYRFTVPGLSAGDVCDLMVRDDEGQYHVTRNLTVARFSADMVKMEKNGLWLEWASVPDRTYEIRRATNPSGPWVAVGTVSAAGTQSRAFVSFEPGQPSGFFRIVLLP